MQEERLVKISFMTEKREGHGEDALPLLVTKEDIYAVGVFDGMGGAGAATCDSEFGEGYTKAYVASRICEKEIETLFEDCLGKEYISPELLKEKLLNRLQKEQDDYPPKTKSMLRSKLVRDYPTTMAVVTLRKTEKELQIDSFWAGDSHCYLWTRKGFHQISKDDLEEDNDPMENLRNDAAISNCICADRDFKINYRQIPYPKEPLAILCATDGCFGYFPTPMHFEDVLKKSLRKAKDEKDWEDQVKKSIQDVTGDDASLSLIGVGFDSFKKFKDAMGTSHEKSIRTIKNIAEEIVSLKDKLEKKNCEYEKAVISGWRSYKQNYLKYLNDESDGNA